MQAAPIIHAKGVTRTYGSGNSAVHALKGADLSIAPGKLVALRGRSGSGKTTLINLLGTLDRPTEGSVFFKDRDVSKLSERACGELRRKEMGLIFQSYGLIPIMSALENVEFALRIAGTPRNRYTQDAEKALEAVGLKARMHHRPFELSGGEQQRVAIARAIAHKPSLILADEPTAELDSRMGLVVMKVFRDLVQETGMTIILTPHDPAIMEIVDHVYALEDGTIVQES